MSVCRFGEDSDVYVYPTIADCIYCIDVTFIGKKDDGARFDNLTTNDTIKKLKELQRKGYKLPDYVLDNLKDREEMNDESKRCN
jgi:hypothetical protein